MADTTNTDPTTAAFTAIVAGLRNTAVRALLPADTLDAAARHRLIGYTDAAFDVLHALGGVWPFNRDEFRMVVVEAVRDAGPRPTDPTDVARWEAFIDGAILDGIVA